MTITVLLPSFEIKKGVEPMTNLNGLNVSEYEGKFYIEGFFYAQDRATLECIEESMEKGYTTKESAEFEIEVLKLAFYC